LPTGPFRHGQVIAGAYEIGRILGGGGMGVVYEAHDRMLDRKVAIKAALTPEYAATLRNEAVAMAAVQHPNLVAIHAMGREGDEPFMVMERVLGGTLGDRIDEAFANGTLVPIDEALGVLVSIADALTAIHRAGLAHRDVKSTNVLLSGRRVVLIDFGLATPEVAVTSGALFVGTIEYLAPELILNDVRPGDGPLLDLYALGVVAFELLTGRLPFEGITDIALLKAHLQQAVPDVRALRPDVPEDLAKLTHELMSKSPVGRPDSSEVLLWRLQALRAKLPRVGVATPPFSVLIVDDDPDVSTLLKHKLEGSLPRLMVSAVTDSTKAMEKINEHPPDIAVVDLNMPGMNGVELCMNIGSLPKRSRPVVVAMSGRCSCDDLAVLRALDVHDFVDKGEGFLRRMCHVIGDVRRARIASSTSSRRARPRNEF
jgi:serine/threonine-protein kinase